MALIDEAKNFKERMANFAVSCLFLGWLPYALFFAFQFYFSSQTMTCSGIILS